MHYYQFNIADYRKDTAHLSPIEHYIYRTLIDWYYLDEQPIPKETQTVSRRLRLETEYEANLNNVLLDFFVLEENGWHHKRIDMEIREYAIKCDKNKENGKRGGRPKKTQPVNSANPNESDSNPNQEPVTSNHKPILKEKVKKKNNEFDAFWNEYPNKTGKQAALKIWEKKKPSLISIMHALSWQTKSQQWLDGYIPNPATYLNQGRWEDEKPPDKVRLSGKDEKAAVAATSIFKGGSNGFENARIIEHETPAKLLG